MVIFDTQRLSHMRAFLWLLLAFVLGCDGTQSVDLTAEDFRFMPERVRVSSGSPLTITFYNAGREMHKIDSPALTYITQPHPLDHASSIGKLGTPLEPGKSVQFAIAPPPGTYLYFCRRKGHANMTGTLIVE